MRLSRKYVIDDCYDTFSVIVAKFNHYIKLNICVRTGQRHTKATPTQLGSDSETVLIKKEHQQRKFLGLYSSTLD